MNLSDLDLMLEAHKDFVYRWNKCYPKIYETRALPQNYPQITGARMNQLQEAWNCYLRLNKKYHGRFVGAKDPNFGKRNEHTS